MKSNKMDFDVETILNLIPENVYWFDANSVFQGCNLQQAIAIGLKSPAEIVGKTVYDFQSKEDAEIIIENNLKVMREKQPMEFQERSRLAGGNHGWFLSRKIPILNASGHVVGLLGVSFNISTLREEQEANKKLLDQIMAHLPVHLYWKDRNGVYLGCNHQQARSLGFTSPEEVVGKTDLDITKNKEEGKKFMENDEQVMKNNKISTLEENAVFEGKNSIVLSQKAPLYSIDGRVIGLVGTSVDITELKQSQEREKNAAVQIAQEKAHAEAEKELRQAVMILAGSIAHDLRSPISTINMRATTLQKSLDYLLNMYRKSGDDKFSESQLKDLETTGEGFKKTAKEMFDSIDVTLKTLSRGLKGGITQEDLVECSMWHCIHNTLLRYPFTDEQRKLVTWDQQDFKFMGNELLIVRVFSNLITNALQQIEKNKKGAIFLSTEINSSGNIIRFRDTAGGAHSEIVNHLFDGYKTTKEKGTGIGLAFCKMTLESFGGTISCHSVEGDYIEFVMTFPKDAAN